MNLILSIVTFTSVAIVHGQQGEKGTSIIPFPRVGRSGSGVEGRYFMEGKRAGNGMTPGLIPFPRVGRGGAEGMHEMKRQLIPFPRVGKRPYWHYPVDPFMYEYEDFSYPMMEANQMGIPSSAMSDSSSSSNVDDIETEKRNANNGGGMWFGPRLGKRRKRSIETDTSAEHSRDSLDTRTLLKILHNFNWAIVPIKERRSTFIPRLGRSSSSSEEQQGVHHNSRSPQVFTPRLGRSREVSSVEVDFEDDQQRSNNRYSSLNNGNSNKNNKQNEAKSTLQSSSSSTISSSADAETFAPRLVRDHLSPRLGRSGEDHD